MINKNSGGFTVLGIDPGLAITGFAVLRKTGGRITPVVYGCIKTSPKDRIQDRLCAIYKQLEKTIDVHKPDSVSIEELFFPVRFSGSGMPLYPKTIVGTGQVRGIVFLLASLKNLGLAEYPPKTVKMSITGYGNADKMQVQNMVKHLLGIKQLDGPDDISDAIAIALCHIYTLSAFKQ